MSTMVFAVVSLVFAGTAYGNEEIPVHVNNQQVYFYDQKPFVDENNRTLIPIRFVSQALGANVNWYPDRGDKGQVEIIRDDIELVFEIEKSSFSRNDDTIEMDTVAQITDRGRTVVPLRALTEALGASVRWSTGKIYIKDDSVDEVINAVDTRVMDKVNEAIAHHNTLDQEIVQELMIRSQESDLDLSLLLGVIRVESVFDPDNVSSSGAVGLFQVMPSTASVIADNNEWEYSRDLLLDPKYNIKVGTTYLEDLMKQYDGDEHKALTAYNKGPVGLQNHIASTGTAVSSYSEIVLQKAEQYKEQLGSY